MNFKQVGKKIVCKSRGVVDSWLSITKEREYRKIAESYDLKGFNRVYFVHIRKTGGTSLNNMFLSLSGEDSSQLYAQLAQTPDNRLLRNGKIYVGWNVKHINKGIYYYAFSHIPFHELSLPDKTFTVSCFRDPVKRVVSHYNMLMDFYVNEIDHHCMETEGKWLGKNFDDFLSKIPRHHLLNQLYMFSSSFNIREAAYNVQKLSYFFFGDNFNEGIDELNEKTGLNLEAVHIRKAIYKAQISEGSLAALRDMLHDEYRFLDIIRELQNV